MNQTERIKTKLTEQLKANLPAGWEDGEVVFEEIYKNNLSKTAFSVRTPKKQMSPTMYLENILNQLILLPMTEDEAISEAVGTYIRAISEIPKVDVEKMCSKEYILNNVFPVFINKEKNKEKILTHPHRDFFDLVVLYRAMAPMENMQEKATYLITTSLCKEITEEELFAAAMKNIEHNEDVDSLYSILSKADYLSEEEDDNDMTGCSKSMIICSNKNRTYGAAQILSLSTQKKICEKLGDKFFILPSSVHELICYPYTEDFREIMHLLNMVSQVNASEVSEEEFLSDNVYRYEKGTFSVIKKYAI